MCNEISNIFFLEFVSLSYAGEFKVTVLQLDRSNVSLFWLTRLRRGYELHFNSAMFRLFSSTASVEKNLFNHVTNNSPNFNDFFVVKILRAILSGVGTVNVWILGFTFNWGEI